MLNFVYCQLGFVILNKKLLFSLQLLWQRNLKKSEILLKNSIQFFNLCNYDVILVLIQTKIKPEIQEIQTFMFLTLNIVKISHFLGQRWDHKSPYLSSLALILLTIHREDYLLKACTSRQGHSIFDFLRKSGPFHHTSFFGNSDCCICRVPMSAGLLVTGT